MDVRVLRYFLAVCEEGSMSRAAEVLHVTQPALSRQIADLERELDCTLLMRESRGVAPTEGGLYLRRRAEEIISLVDQTKAEFIKDEMVEGDVYIGAGESDGMRVVAERIKKFREAYPQVCFHLHSGNSVDVIERLERGLDDFAVESSTLIFIFSFFNLLPTDLLKSEVSAVILTLTFCPFFVKESSFCCALSNALASTLTFTCASYWLIQFSHILSTINVQ